MHYLPNYQGYKFFSKTTNIIYKTRMRAKPSLMAARPSKLSKRRSYTFRHYWTKVHVQRAFLLANIKLRNCELELYNLHHIWTFQVVKILRAGSSNFGPQNVFRWEVRGDGVIQCTPCPRKKTSHFNFQHNFAICWDIFYNFWLLD